MQQKYSVTEIELSAIVETSKEFKGMLWGQKIKVFTEHNILSKMPLASPPTESIGGGYSSKSMALK